MRAIAVDLGASSGRVVQAEFADAMELKEAHRFRTSSRVAGGFLRWDLGNLCTEIRTGLAKAGRADSIAIDSWAVDFVLFDKAGQPIADPIRYRDPTHKVGAEELRNLRAAGFAETGIQPLQFNTAAQMLARKMREDAELAEAATFMMIPDAAAFLLAESAPLARWAERTNASTTQMLRTDGEWIKEFEALLGKPDAFFPPLCDYGKTLGTWDKTPILATASHDTASAVAACPLGKNAAFISSGTWSLVGIESAQPITTEAALRKGFSNERGIDGTFRFLKNVAGLWLLQRVQGARSAEECAAMAASAPSFVAHFDVNDESLVNPDDMAQQIRRISTAPIETEAALYRVIFENLAASYARTIRDIEEITGEPIESVCVVGGGSKNRLLNQMAADAAGLPVYAGPAEATALGNALCQFAALSGIESVRGEGRSLIAKSYPREEFLPRGTREWQDWMRRA